MHTHQPSQVTTICTYIHDMFFCCMCDAPPVSPNYRMSNILGLRAESAYGGGNLVNRIPTINPPRSFSSHGKPWCTLHTCVAGIDRGPSVLKHKYHPHLNHEVPEGGFGGSRQLSPYGGGLARGSITPPPPPIASPVTPRPTCGPFLLLSPSMQRWGPPRRQA